MGFLVRILVVFLVACSWPTGAVWAPAPLDVRWDETPISVYAEPEVSDWALSQAMGQWNEVCFLFVRVSEPRFADVKITRGTADLTMTEQGIEVGTYGEAWKSALGNIRIVVYSITPGGEYVAILQGLGKALGLAPDDYSRSAMARRVQWREPLPHLEVAPEDRRALRQRYCQAP